MARRALPPDLVLRLTVVTDADGHALSVRTAYLRPDRAPAEVDYLPRSPHPDEALFHTLLFALEVAARDQPRCLQIQLSRPQTAAMLERRETVPADLLLPYMQVRARLNAFPRVQIAPLPAEPVSLS